MIITTKQTTVEKFIVQDWDGTKLYSDYIREGMERTDRSEERVVMLFESPSSSATDSSFHNKEKFRFHDWPAPKSSRAKGVLGPCRYALMNGDSYPVYLRDASPPEGLMEHWMQFVPSFRKPQFVPKISDEENTVYAYLPVEQLRHHVNDPQKHYHLAGKDAIHLMTQKVWTRGLDGTLQCGLHPQTHLKRRFFLRPPNCCPTQKRYDRALSRRRIPWDPKAYSSLTTIKTMRNLKNS
jgi:hypothetical protein